MNLAEAVAFVILNAQTAAFPELTPQQVSDIVERNARATIWTAGKQYKIGDRVQPTAPNGHFYKCIENGISAAVEPTWTLRYANTVRDGATLVWEECGEDLDGNLYNTRNAVHDAWLLKASIAANQFDTSIDNQKWTRSQIHEHCLKMSGVWSPFD